MTLEIVALDRITDAVPKYHPKSNPDKQFRAATKKTEPHELYKIHLADAFAWLESCEPQSIHAIVTDPPYGLKEYSDAEKKKLRKGRGGVWRITPIVRRLQAKPYPKIHRLGRNRSFCLARFLREIWTICHSRPGSRRSCHDRH